MNEKMLLVLVEGQTEENFVNTHLRPLLLENGFVKIDARIMGSRRERSRRGGIVKWTNLQKNLQKLLKQSSKKTWLVTTMFDYYGLEDKGYPNWNESKQRPSVLEKEEQISSGMKVWIRQKLGDSVACRFIPYVMMYEFEGILFSDVNKLSEVIGPQHVVELQAIRNNFLSPEYINNSKETAPSKRLLRLTHDGYNKILDGNRVVQKTTLEVIRNECEVFNNWIEKLLHA